jgi:o-succinylbenzoate synthase
LRSKKETISSSTITQESIKLKLPFKTALREVDSAEFVRIELKTANGLSAFGEAPATKAITGETLESIRADLEDVAAKLKHKSLREALVSLHVQAIGSSAKAALDMALVTLLAKEKGCSLAEYFGVSDKRPIKTDITISLNDTKSMLREAEAAFAKGMDILKVKLGSDIAHAISTTRQLAQNLPQAKLLIDANQAWSLRETLNYIEAVDDLDIKLIEQPLQADALDDMKRITKRSSIPILADESVFTLQDAKNVVEQKAADMINIKLMKCGGVTKAVEILEYAREQGIACMLGSMIEGPYSINITLYLAFAYRDVVQFVDLDSPLLYKEPPSELDFSYSGALISFKESQRVWQ